VHTKLTGRIAGFGIPECKLGAHPTLSDFRSPLARHYTPEIYTRKVVPAFSIVRMLSSQARRHVPKDASVGHCASGDPACEIHERLMLVPTHFKKYSHMLPPLLLYWHYRTNIGFANLYMCNGSGEIPSLLKSHHCSANWLGLSFGHYSCFQNSVVAHAQARACFYEYHKVSKESKLQSLRGRALNISVSSDIVGHVRNWHVVGISLLRADV
jgi:hypothetical protein